MRGARLRSGLSMALCSLRVRGKECEVHPLSPFFPRPISLLSRSGSTAAVLSSRQIRSNRRREGRGLSEEGAGGASERRGDGGRTRTDAGRKERSSLELCSGSSIGFRFVCRILACWFCDELAACQHPPVLRVHVTRDALCNLAVDVGRCVNLFSQPSGPASQGSIPETHTAAS
eukprot:25954-Rhodomonas_salina.2